MSVSPDEVRYVARLARLSFTADEETRMAIELSRILDYMGQLDGLQLDDVEPMERVSDREGGLRDDVLKSRIVRSQALKSAPDADDRYFRVPRVIE